MTSDSVSAVVAGITEGVVDVAEIIEDCREQKAKENLASVFVSAEARYCTRPNLDLL